MFLEDFCFITLHLEQMALKACTIVRRHKVNEDPYICFPICGLPVGSTSYSETAPESGVLML